jgi:hypothetical protein
MLFIPSQKPGENLLVYFFLHANILHAKAFRTVKTARGHFYSLWRKGFVLILRANSDFRALLPITTNEFSSAQILLFLFKKNKKKEEGEQTQVQFIHYINAQ